MRIPKVKKRRQYGYLYSGHKIDAMESDNDFIENNLYACIWFLENRDKINAIIKETKKSKVKDIP